MKQKSGGCFAPIDVLLSCQPVSQKRSSVQLFEMVHLLPQPCILRLKAAPSWRPLSRNWLRSIK
jgi:hypothetical protein